MVTSSKSTPGATLNSMKKGRCLGLVGGLGVGAAVHYYQSLAKAHEARERTLDLVMAHAETATVFAMSKQVIATDWRNIWSASFTV